MSRIVLTFKNNDKEKAIEKFLDEKLSATAYLKELVWEKMQEKKDNAVVEQKKEIEDPANNFDFGSLE
ncbi:TPA: hypothetical protein P1J70_002655 [Clostridioides difficile]|uniref:hypothetical protein n=1 Tax=Clostridioides TaxID=1870884 RepID=UPI00038D2F18|nr:hypothetical protein [Clostridioides difficile]MCC0693433.1 hypothetical protein [Clostridioides sp. ZZV14-6387]EAA0001166.1 hypothetical protein [Clostridioides difficile]EGT3728786.1 hypothetical protein [Clostridioides difficile]EGT3734458.1 hypothetical protein [Clostridioides difficile]EGT3772564.1 hypothetical protein [Clostridioides difficile]